nr:MAG TPA: putative integral membrane zinc-ribbon metal-binding protein [Caudoviricetes sp.]
MLVLLLINFWQDITSIFAKICSICQTHNQNGYELAHK